MSDPALAIEILTQILSAASRFSSRFPHPTFYEATGRFSASPQACMANGQEAG